jgi:hypothetical protein
MISSSFETQILLLLTKDARTGLLSSHAGDLLQ